MIMQGQVQAPPTMSATDGNNYSLIQGKQLDLLVSEFHGKYFTQNSRGNLFAACLTTATAIPAPATNATPNFLIWNPAGNTVAVSLVSFQFGYVSGTGAAASFGYSFIPYAGATVGGTGAIAAITTLTIRSCAGRAYSGQVMVGSTATVTGTAPAAEFVLRWSGLSQGILASASIPPGMNLREDFDGTIIIPPGNALLPVSSAASGATFMVSAVWEEIPWP